MITTVLENKLRSQRTVQKKMASVEVQATPLCKIQLHTKRNRYTYSSLTVSADWLDGKTLPSGALQFDCSADRYRYIKYI